MGAKYNCCDVLKEADIICEFLQLELLIDYRKKTSLQSSHICDLNSYFKCEDWGQLMYDNTFKRFPSDTFRDKGTLWAVRCYQI